MDNYVITDKTGLVMYKEFASGEDCRDFITNNLDVSESKGTQYARIKPGVQWAYFSFYNDETGCMYQSILTKNNCHTPGAVFTTAEWIAEISGVYNQPGKYITIYSSGYNTGFYIR